MRKRFMTGIVLMLSAAVLTAPFFTRAAGLFELAATPTPEVRPTDTPAPPPQRQDLFGMLATATPSPVPTPTPEPTATPAPTATPVPTPVPTADPAEAARVSELSGGVGFSDLTGREPERIFKNGTSFDCVYEQVTQNEFERYTAFLFARGCTTEEAETGPQGAFAGTIIHGEKGLRFRAVYQPDLLRLTLSFTSGGKPAMTAAPSEQPASGNAGADRHETRVCTHCDWGFCRRCEGIGYFLCTKCGGTGRCTVCNGRARRLPNYGGTGGSTYVTCSTCHGSNRCDKCGGNKRFDCPDCDDGACRYCHGEYFLDP